MKNLSESDKNSENASYESCDQPKGEEIDPKPKPLKKKAWTNTPGISRSAIFRRYRISSWGDKNMLAKRARCAGKQKCRLLTYEQAQRLIAACAEFTGVKGLVIYDYELGKAVRAVHARNRKVRKIPK